MTLALILVFRMVCGCSGVPAPPGLAAYRQTAPQAASESQPNAAGAQDRATADKGAAPKAQTPPTAAPRSSGPSATPAAPRYHHKKRVLPVNCKPGPGVAGPGASGSSPAPPDPAAAESAPAHCPPPKVVVQHGGIPEPSIQLAGGAAGDQKSYQRDTANQLLESTDANLKKIAGRQLNANQLDMVHQTRQFMEQAKSAAADGDLDRARTLAWKAQLLSEALVKPEK